jgi:hypothetical protein
MSGNPLSEPGHEFMAGDRHLAGDECLSGLGDEAVRRQPRPRLSERFGEVRHVVRVGGSAVCLITGQPLPNLPNETVDSRGPLKGRRFAGVQQAQQPESELVDRQQSEIFSSEILSHYARG